ncbi:MAG: DUF975 family protein [Oscillospiraceae bacterium]
MKIDRVMLKLNARAAIRDAKAVPYITALVYVFIAYILQLLYTRIAGVTLDYEVISKLLNSGNPQAYADYVMEQMPSAGAWFVGELLSIMTMMLSVGLIINTLHVRRHEESVVGNLFDGFANFFRILWLQILITVFVGLWSLLFVIPGFIASYRYSQALYILIDNPQMSAIDCIRESKRMMRGHKAERFLLDLSFFGWTLLSLLPFMPVYVFPYIYTTQAAYYDALLDIDHINRRERINGEI